MALKEKIIFFIQNFIDEEIEEKIELQYDSKLFGGDGPLDSMALVNLIVDLEDFIEDEYDKSITLADEKAMSRRTSPFSRVNLLIDYIKEKIENENE